MNKTRLAEEQYRSKLEKKIRLKEMHKKENKKIEKLKKTITIITIKYKNQKKQQIHRKQLYEFKKRRILLENITNQIEK